MTPRLPDNVIVALRRDPLDGLWSTKVEVPGLVLTASTSDSPGGALELVGQHLDRLAAEDAIDGVPASALEADGDDQQAEDVGRVLEVLGDARELLTTDEVARASGLERQRALIMLRLAETAGAVVCEAIGVTVGARQAGDFLWRAPRPSDLSPDGGTFHYEGDRPVMDNVGTRPETLGDPRGDSDR